MTEAAGRRILVVEDEAATRDLVASYLGEFGFHVTTADSARAFRQVVRTQSFDVCLIDRRLPDGDGLDLARELKLTSDAGILFVTAVGGEIDAVVGLELGADDYVVKPIALRELVARVRSTLRRVDAARARPAAPTQDRTIWLGSWLVDLSRRRVSDRVGEELLLTRGEFDLLAALVEANGRPLNRDFLLELVSERADDVTDRSIDTLVSRLRKKLGKADDGRPLIETQRGIGYRANLQRS